MLAPPVARSTKTDNSDLLSIVKIPRLSWKIPEDIDIIYSLTFLWWLIRRITFINLEGEKKRTRLAIYKELLSICQNESE